MLDARLARLCAELLVSADASANLACCAPRRAPRSSWRRRWTTPPSPEMLGTIAGDDTVLVITRAPDGGVRWPNGWCSRPAAPST